MPSSPLPYRSNVIPLVRKSQDSEIGNAIRWLAEMHRKGWRAAFDAVGQKWGLGGTDWSDLGDAAVMESVGINVGEWLVARGEIFARGSMRSINAHLLGSDGPYLTPGQKGWIAQMANRFLRLYRVTEVKFNEGFTLVDALDFSTEPLFVHDRSASRGLKAGVVIGLRIMNLDDHFVLSGAVYPFSALHAASVVQQVQQARTDGLSAGQAQLQEELVIARAWLAQWLQPIPMPQIRDALSGDPIVLITDHYRVIDAAALARQLQFQPDVQGDAVQGWRRVVSTDGVVRDLAIVNPGQSSDRIEVFYKTMAKAEQGCAWFESIAGLAVQHLTREVVDPTSPKVFEGLSSPQKSSPKLDPLVMSEAMLKIVRRHYANWADEPIPALNGQTPRQAIQTTAGIERVKGLLRSYEEGEIAIAQQQGRPAISYQFLWDELKLTH